MTTVITIISALIIYGLVITIHEFGHFITAKISGIRVNEFSIGMGPKLFSRQKGETQYSLRAFPIGGFVSMEGEDEDSDDERSFNKAPVGNRILVSVAGAAMNLLLGFVVMLIFTCSEDVISSRTIYGFQVENSVTEASGLQAEDTILAINGRRMYCSDDISYELLRVENVSADMTVLRDGKKVELEDVRFEQTTYEDGSSGIVVDFIVYGVRKSFSNVIRYAFLSSVSLGRQVFISLIDLITGRAAINQLSGPVGIISVISTVASYRSIKTMLRLLALITINLGIFNLLPVPALDGGRLFLLLFEAITKKRLDTKYEAIVNIVGFVLLMGLMLFVTYNDITRLFVK